MAGGVPSVIDMPPIPWPVALAVLGWGVAVLGLTWRASSKLTGLENRISHVEGEVENDLTGRKAVAEMRDRLTRIEMRVEAIADKLDAR